MNSAMYAMRLPLKFRKSMVIHKFVLPLPSCSRFLSTAPEEDETKAKKSKGKSTKKKGKDSENSGRDRSLEKLLKFYNTATAVQKMKLDWSPEELAEHSRIGRTYHAESFRRINKHEKDLADKIWLQQEAIRALPPHLKERALEIDETPPPRDRPWPYFDTPPIKDFDLKKYIKSDGNKGRSVSDDGDDGRAANEEDEDESER